jgi:hypothetical protein
MHRLHSFTTCGIWLAVLAVPPGPKSWPISYPTQPTKSPPPPRPNPNRKMTQPPTHRSRALTWPRSQDSLDRIAPEGRMYRHDDEGPDDMPAHVKSSLMGASLTVRGVAGRVRLPSSRGRGAGQPVRGGRRCTAGLGGGSNWGAGGERACAGRAPLRSSGLPAWRRAALAGCRAAGACVFWALTWAPPPPAPGGSSPAS